MTAQADTTKRDSVLAKVRKMLDLAEGSDKQGEIDAALAQASKLMAMHAIEQAEVDALRTDGKPEQIIDRPVILGKYGSPTANDRGRLGMAVAETNRCRVYRSRGFRAEDGTWHSGYTLHIVGYESDVDYVEMLLTSLSLQMDAAHDKAKKNKREWVNGRTFRSEFNGGFVSEAWDRLRNIARETDKAVREQDVANMRAQLGLAEGEYATQEQAEQVLSTSGALVLRDREKDVEAFLKKAVPGLRSGRSYSYSKNSDAHARQAGRNAGARADYSGGRTARIGARAQLGRG